MEYKVYIETQTSPRKMELLGVFYANSFVEACVNALQTKTNNYSAKDFAIRDGFPMCNGMKMFPNEDAYLPSNKKITVQCIDCHKDIEITEPEKGKQLIFHCPYCSTTNTFEHFVPRDEDDEW